MTLCIPSHYLEHKQFISIDPGTNFLGLSIFTIRPLDFSIVKIEPFTIDVGKLENLNQEVSDTYNDRLIKLIKIQNTIAGFLAQVKPFAVICESPFYNRLRPSAYGPLVETLQTIKLAVFGYNSLIEFQTIEPTLVKKAVNAGYIDSKDEVKKAILNIELIRQTCSQDLMQLSEHALDSIAVGYAYQHWLMKNKLP